MSGPSTPSDTSAAIVVQDDHVLLARQPDRHNKLTWQYPTGDIRAGHNADQAAEQATFEETGLVVKAVKRLDRRTMPTTGHTLHYTACTPITGTAHVRDTDHTTEVAWVPVEDIPQHIPAGLYRPVHAYVDSAQQHRP